MGRGSSLYAFARHRDAIIEVLRQAGQSLDDDQLARRAAITPRQTVNRICRSLERAGVLRYTGAEGRIVNELTG
jgi:DNA-binding IclR family transcriptional regulator